MPLGLFYALIYDIFFLKHHRGADSYQAAHFAQRFVYRTMLFAVVVLMGRHVDADDLFCIIDISYALNTGHIY